MIVLDTNVISELMRPSPDPNVLAWIAERPIGELATTCVNVAEINYGLARLAAGRRRRDLELQFRNFISGGFASRLFDFDAAAAATYGDIVVERERGGRPLEGFDGLIAAIAKSRGAAIATRNAADFDGCGIDVLNPYEARRR